MRLRPDPRAHRLVALILLTSLFACKGSASESDAGPQATASPALRSASATTAEDLVPLALPPAGSTAGWIAVVLGDATFGVPPAYGTTDTGSSSRRYTNPKEPGVQIVVSNSYQQVAPSSRTILGLIADYRKMPGRKSVQERTVAGTSGVLFWVPSVMRAPDEDFGWVGYRNIVPARDYYGYRVGVSVGFPQGTGDRYKQLLSDVLSTLKLK